MSFIKVRVNPQEGLLDLIHCETQKREIILINRAG